MEPVVTRNSFNLAPEAIVLAALVGIAVGLAAFGLRRFLLATLDELVELVRDLVPSAASILGRRSAAQADPWFCAACHSQNRGSATHCYSCGAARADVEAPVPDAPPPAGPSGGGTLRRG